MTNLCEGQYFVLGGELANVDPDCKRFSDLSKVHFVGGFDTYQAAYDAWRANAQSTVDNAHMRYFIVSGAAFFPCPNSAHLTREHLAKLEAKAIAAAAALHAQLEQMGSSDAVWMDTKILHLDDEL